MSLEETLQQFVETISNLPNGSPHMDRRAEIRKRWPGLKTGAYALEAFDRACNIMQREPGRGEIYQYLLNLDCGINYTQDDLSKIWKTDIYKTEALTHFAVLLFELAPVGRSGHYLIANGKWTDLDQLKSKEKTIDHAWVV